MCAFEDEDNVATHVAFTEAQSDGNWTYSQLNPLKQSWVPFETISFCSAWVHGNRDELFLTIALHDGSSGFAEHTELQE